MLARLQRIKSEFGTKTYLKTILLLVALPAMAVFGFAAFSSPWPAVVVVVGILLGWLLRRIIVDRTEQLVWAIPAALTVYGIVLLVGDRVLGMSRLVQLLIITATTVLLFDVQFWSLSDPSIINIERQDRDQ